jgi:hypothetical protein
MRRLRPQAWSASEPPARDRAVVGRALAGMLPRTSGDPLPDAQKSGQSPAYGQLNVISPLHRQPASRGEKKRGWPGLKVLR